MSAYLHKIHSRTGAGDGDRGASALEFAIVLPVLLVLLFGFIEFAFVFQGQLAVTHAAREGARLAAVDKWDASVVEDRAFPLTTADGLTISNTDMGSAVRVDISYVYVPTLLVFIPDITLSSSAEMRKEF